MTKAKNKIREWRQDPVLFVRETFKTEPDAWQKVVLEALVTNNRLAMKACKGPGKTALLAWTAWWFLSCHLHPKIAATSISADNLSDGLWTEMAKWQSRSPFLQKAFKWTKTRIFAIDHPETWWMSARTWPKGADTSQQANTLAGLHADNLMFMLDEAGGVPDAVMAAAEAGLANDTGQPGHTAKIIMAGNPTHLEGPLYRATTSEREMWHLTEITADPNDPLRTPRVSKQWAQDQIKKYGKDNPWVLVNVFGKFPPSSINSLLGPDDVSAAIARSLTVKKSEYDFSQKRLGVDVARFGDDRSIIVPRQGIRMFDPVELRGARSNTVAARVAEAKQKWGSELELVDGTGGYGSGVIDFLIQAGHSPNEVQFSGKSFDERYANKRAEMWFLMAEWVKKVGCLPNNSELAKELTAPTYTFSAQGRFIIEPKDQIKSRLGFSPDIADALALTFAVPEMAASWKSQFGIEDPRPKINVDYEPYADERLD